MKIDYHVHTAYSDDSTYPMESCVLEAIQLGIEEICFTDHVDYGVKKDWCDGDIEYRNNEPLANVDYPKYIKEIRELKEKYAKKITIKTGFEFGVQSITIQQFEQLFQSYALDFVILSIHQVNNKEFWTYEFQKGKSQKEYYEAYYQEMYNVVQSFHNYSVLGHMDLIKRYDDKNGYDGFIHHKEIITKILKYIIKEGKGIELNTSSKKYKLTDLMPSKQILKWYLELGGKIITIGSDSHSESDLRNADIETFKKELIEIGFEEYCTFENMIPIFHSLKE